MARRKKGIGSKLLNEIIKMDCKHIMLEVNTKNIGAVNLYKKNNFKIINTRKNYYKTDDAYVMELIK